MHIVYRTYPGEGSKPRPEWYSKRACLANLLRVFGPDHQYHFLVDGGGQAFCEELDGFARNLGVAPVVTPLNERQNGGAFRRMLDYSCSLRGLLYLVEDDYLHRPGAAQVLAEGSEHWDYVTGYDHPDKYSPSEPYCYAEKPSILHAGQWCHWREVPSTTGTFAVQSIVLCEDQSVWETWCRPELGWARDHQCFTELTQGRQGATVASTVPAFSTHCESQWLAPVVDWSRVSKCD